MSTLPVSPAGRRYGVLTAPLDPRDLAFTPTFVHLPQGSFWDHVKGLFGVPKQAPEHIVNSTKVDLRPWAGPVKNQGDLGACTGFAYAGLMELLCRKYPEQLPAAAGGLVDPTKVVLSPLFVYWWNRRNDGKLEVESGRGTNELAHINEDAGATMRAGMRTLRWQGVCLEKEHPYEPRHFAEKPSVADCEEALLFRGGAYHALYTLDDMKNCLRSGYPFALAIDIYDSFESEYVAKTGHVPVPNPRREKLQGGHAVLCVGFDEKRGHLIVRNSWGAEWGDGGNFYLPFTFLPYISDAWMMHFGRPWA